MTQKSKILCAISGGVDSAVAAHLLLEKGCDVTGAFMRIPNRPESDFKDVEAVADGLGIKLLTFDFKREFENLVDYFITEYSAGRTPNPCAACNRLIKFGALRNAAAGLGFNSLATGHYSRIVERDGRPFLARPVDRAKDQTYFLFALDREQLAASVFPCGELTKKEIREIAGRADLPSAEKAESQDVCFTGGLTPAEYFERNRPELLKEGPVLDADVLGTHGGIQCCTVGQRRGLGIALGKPAYVTAIDAKRNAVILGADEDLYERKVLADGMSWALDTRETSFPLRASAQVRYNMEAVPCTLTIPAEGMMEAEFDEPVRGVTPGQALVAYTGELLIGGGWIV